MQPYVFLIEVWLAKSSFQNIISIKSYQEKTFRGRLAPLDREELIDHNGIIMGSNVIIICILYYEELIAIWIQFNQDKS